MWTSAVALEIFTCIQDDVPQDVNEMVSLFEELTKELIREGE